jgi:hypothetical protein
MAPVFTTGPYALYPLHVCSEDAIAKLFVKICSRGNPILQGKTAADLHRLGVAFYKKSVGSEVSMVFLKGVEPVALQFGWDVFDGGVWKGTSGPPESLACHAAIGAAIFASVPHEAVPGRDMFLAFVGVAPPHPGTVLMHAMQIMSVFSSQAAGYTTLFGYAVHAKTIEQSQAYTDNACGTRNVWRVSYRDIEVEDEKVREELCGIIRTRGMWPLWQDSRLKTGERRLGESALLLCVKTGASLAAAPPLGLTSLRMPSRRGVVFCLREVASKRGVILYSALPLSRRLRCSGGTIAAPAFGRALNLQRTAELLEEPRLLAECPHVVDCSTLVSRSSACVLGALLGRTAFAGGCRGRLWRLVKRMR